MTQLGNLSFGWHSTQDVMRVVQSDPRITWDCMVFKDALRYRRAPPVNVVLQDMVHKPDTINGFLGLDGKPNFTDLKWIKYRFDIAISWMNNYSYGGYEYGVFLFWEEMFHPSIRASWLPGSSGIKTWVLDGTLDIAGQHLELIRTWYIRTKGAWDQTWWNLVSTSNKYNDPIILQWSEEYAAKLYQAWHEHMHSLGKKSCVMGTFGLSDESPETNNDLYPGKMGQYIYNNYDLLFTYTYPTVIGPMQPGQIGTDLSVKHINALRALGFRGKICHILTACWEGNGPGCPWIKEVAHDEYKKVSPLVDFVAVTYQVNDNFTGDLYPPILLEFYESTCPPSQCDFTITQ